MPTPTVYTPKRLITPQQLVASTATLYTTPGSTTTKVTAITLINDTTTAVTATLYVVESGGSSDEAHMILNAASIPTDGTPLVIQFDEFYLNAADIISGKASVANQVSIQISGVELT